MGFTIQIASYAEVWYFLHVTRLCVLAKLCRYVVKQVGKVIHLFFLREVEREVKEIDKTLCNVSYHKTLFKSFRTHAVRLLTSYNLRLTKAK